MNNLKLLNLIYGQDYYLKAVTFYVKDDFANMKYDDKRAEKGSDFLCCGRGHGRRLKR